MYSTGTNKLNLKTEHLYKRNCRYRKGNLHEVNNTNDKELKAKLRMI